MSAEHVVYEDSPLGEYLSATGDEALQQVEPELMNSDASSDSEEPSQPANYAPSSANLATPTLATNRPKQSGNSGLRPLFLGNERSMRRLRFQFLFTTPLRKKLGPRENSRFLERFRYILVTSQLLDESASVATHGRPVDDGSGLVLSAKARRHIVSGSATRYWAGSGGCIVVVAVLLSWLLRSGDKHVCVSSKCRLLIGLVLATSISLFFFAHAWRKRLRSTRVAAIKYATQFVESSHAFDANITRTIGLVQEVEFISRGFKLPSSQYSTPNKRAPSVSKKRKSSLRIKKCKKLRSQISSVLDLSLSIYSRSIYGLSELCNHSDLAKYLDIYDLHDTPEPEREREDENDSNDDDGEANIELWRLKQQFRELHHSRRKLICCLLAMDSHGDTSDVNKWKIVVQDLKSLSDLMKKLSDDLGQSLMQDDVAELVEICADSNSVLPSEQLPASPATDPNRFRPHLRTLSNMSATLRNIEAKLYVLREDSARLERQESRSAQATPTSLKRSSTGLGLGLDSSKLFPDLLKQYDSLGADLKSLVKEWESGRVRFDGGSRSQAQQAYQSPPSSTMSSPDSLLSGTTFESTSTPWSPKSMEDHSFIVRDLEDEDDEHDEHDEQADVSMAVKARMVEGIASAMVRQQERILSLH